mgnify:CR=1 FL=1
MTFQQAWAQSVDADFVNQVKVAIVKAAIAISAEDGGTANHANRASHARNVLLSPASYAANLRAVDTLRRRYKVPVGYSGHEVGCLATLAAAWDLIPGGGTRLAPALGLALVSRVGDLSGVRIMGGGGSDLPIYDASWYDAFPDTFALETSYVLPLIRDLIAQKKSDFIVSGLFGVPDIGADMPKPIDVFMVQISPPDEHGFCSFGNSLWMKKEWARSAKKVMGEVNKNIIRTHGDNYIHVSEIDYFVEQLRAEGVPVQTGVFRATMQVEIHNDGPVTILLDREKEG